MPLPKLLIITDWSLGEERVLAAVDAALQASPQVAVQHRHPGAPARTFIEEGRALARVVARHPGRRLFVNGRLDAALLLDADLHLPADAPRPAEVRPFLPAGRLISASVHSVAEAAQSRAADLALVSPVFSPGSKPEDRRAPLGPEAFAAICSALQCPGFALGGVTPSTVGLVGSARGVAVVSAVFGATDPGAAAAALVAAVCSLAP